MHSATTTTSFTMFCTSAQASDAVADRVKAVNSLLSDQTSTRRVCSGSFDWIKVWTEKRFRFEADFNYSNVVAEGAVTASFSLLSRSSSLLGGLEDVVGS